MERERENIIIILLYFNMSDVSRQNIDNKDRPQDRGEEEECSEGHVEGVYASDGVELRVSTIRQATQRLDYPGPVPFVVQGGEVTDRHQNECEYAYGSHKRKALK